MTLQQAPTSAESSQGEESADLAAGGATLTPTELAAVGYEGGFTDPTALAEWMGIVNDQSSANDDAEEGQDTHAATFVAPVGWAVGWAVSALWTSSHGTSRRLGL